MQVSTDRSTVWSDENWPGGPPILKQHSGNDVGEQGGSYTEYSCMCMAHSAECKHPTLLDQGHLDLWVLAQLVGTAQASRPSAHNDDITLCIVLKVLEVATGHGTVDICLLDGCLH